MRGPLVVFLQVLELHEHFQLVNATLLKEKFGGRDLGQTFELQIAVLVRLRHAIPKRILPGDRFSCHHGNLREKRAERRWLGVAGHKGFGFSCHQKAERCFGGHELEVKGLSLVFDTIEAQRIMGPFVGREA